MYETEQLVFVQLQKAGSTHIAKLLAKILNGHPPFDGEGKHAKASDEQINSGKLIVSSIRNPFDWYASLWTFGCSGKGGLRHRLLRNDKDSATIDTSKWNYVYQDKDEAKLFREWLCMLLDPSNRDLIAENLLENSFAKHCGFMTYRYMRLCWKDADAWKNLRNTASPAEILELDKAQCYVDDFIRLEQLENEFCRVISNIRPLSEEEKAMVHGANPTNASHRRLSLQALYTHDIADKLCKADSLLFDKFGYNSLWRPAL
jgi:hypothetical protein